MICLCTLPFLLSDLFSAEDFNSCTVKMTGNGFQGDPYQGHFYFGRNQTVTLKKLDISGIYRQAGEVREVKRILLGMPEISTCITFFSERVAQY